LAVAPGGAEFVGRHRHRREGRGRLGLQETETLGQFGGNQVAQADIVDQHQQADLLRALLGRCRQRHVAGDHRHLGLEIDAPGFVTGQYRIAGSGEAVRTALVHQRIGPELGRQLGAARLAHQFDVIDVGRAIGPLVGARQGAGTGAGRRARRGARRRG
jgi:hypothetical protein